MILHFACPNCGADMAYSIKKGKLFCEHCGTEKDIGPDPAQWLQETAEDSRPDGTSGPADTASSTSAEPASDGNAKQAQPPICPNCGSPLSPDPKKCSTRCEYCDSSIIFSERLCGSMRPARILPFQLDREDVAAAFRKWCHNGRFSPRGFASAKNIKNITPMYVPYWLYDMDVDVNVLGTATRVNVYVMGDTEYTETSFYDVERRLNLRYDSVPYDASTKMDDALMAKIQPYNFDEMKTFEIPYLAGFETNQRDYEDKELLPLVQQKVDEYAVDYARGTIDGYSSVMLSSQTTQYNHIQSNYVYLPLWFISYPYQGEDYIFAMNGQTGKVIGRPPIAKIKVFGWFMLITAISFAIIMLIEVMLL